MILGDWFTAPTPVHMDNAQPKLNGTSTAVVWIKQNHLDCLIVRLFHSKTMLCHILIYAAEGISAFNAALV